ncbi:MAG: AraC family transcriptional regulator [Pseudomonadales bacterium]|nr:AraC family transcriptional regulator [Pseudomonadales bacterium]
MSPLDHASIHASYAKVLVELLVSRGADREQLLEQVGISPDILEAADAKVSGNQFNELVDAGFKFTQDPNLGVWFGLQLKISTHGFLGYAALSSAKLGEAIELGVKYAKTRLGLVNIDFYIDGDDGVIAVDSMIPVDKDLERFFLQTFYTSFAVMGENLIGTLPEDIEAYCTYSEPEFDPKLAELFDDKHPHYDQPVNQIRIPKQYLDLPLGMSDPVSKQLMEEQCRKELESLGQFDDLLVKVRQEIVAEPGRFPKLEEVAEKCFMSSRTFNRRLADL